VPTSADDRDIKEDGIAAAVDQAYRDAALDHPPMRGYPDGPSPDAYQSMDVASAAYKVAFIGESIHYTQDTSSGTQQGSSIAGHFSL